MSYMRYESDGRIQRFNSSSGAVEEYDKRFGWYPVDSPPSYPEPPEIRTYSGEVISVSPPSGPSGVSRPTGRKLPYSVETMESLMPDMTNDQLDDIIDAALEELRIRKRITSGD